MKATMESEKPNVRSRSAGQAAPAPARIQLRDLGFVHTDGVFEQNAIDAIAEIVRPAPSDAWKRRRGAAYAMRDAQCRIPGLIELLANTGLDAHARGLMGRASLVSATVFDKVAEANWTVPPHQDLFVSVSCRAQLPGFSSWCLRDGVHYVSPPETLLSELLAVRLHLDDCPIEGGALEVVPHTHARRLGASEIAAIDPRDYVPCPARAGDVLAMRPLLVHKSRSSRSPGHRRVLHVLYASCAPPRPLCWTT